VFDLFIYLLLVIGNTKGMAHLKIFLYFYHLSNSCIYKIVTYETVETILGTKWNISASQCGVAAIYNLL
jgi:hypothetical protein